MADYTTYDQISWADGTPITSDRLQQMSTNIDLVKDVTDGYSKGIIAFTATPETPAYKTDETYHPVIRLDSTVSLAMTVDAQRYVKVTFVTQGIEIANGNEDEIYSWKLVDATSYHIDNVVQEWFFGIEGGDVIVDASTITPHTAAKKIGGGTFTMMFNTGALGWTSENLGIYLGRTGTEPLTSYRLILPSGVTKHQFFAEDCGQSV